jgi:hypothetical protein
MQDIRTEARNTDMTEIMGMLQEQRTRRLDVIVPADLIAAEDGQLVVASGDATKCVTDEGVTDAAGTYRITERGIESLAGRLDASGGWLKKCHTTRGDIFDATVNSLLHGGTSGCAPADDDYTYPAFKAGTLLRLLKGDEDGRGVLRAAMSPKYRIMDNLDVALAVLDGFNAAGVDAKPGVCDLSDRAMHLRFEVPELAMMAPHLLDGYRSPLDGPGSIERADGGDDRPGMRLRSDWGGWSVESALAAARREGQAYEPGTEPVVWAGIVVSNSDVGDGARTISPQIRVRVCRNGLTLLAESDRKVHLGTAQQEGVVNWSAATQEAELQLIKQQTIDAVTTWMTPEWFTGQVQAIEALAGQPVPNPETTIKAVAKSAAFTKAEADGILAHFLRGGAYTAGGVANAVTSYSQTVASPERAAWLDTKAIRAMELAAR